MNDRPAQVDGEASDSVIRSAALGALAGIEHAYFTRVGGYSSGIYATLNGGQGSSDEPEVIARNRERMGALLGVEPHNLLSVHQIHSADVVTVSEAWDRSARPKADGMVTRIPGLALGIATADCGPVLFADARAGVIGACHAGWKGAFGGVIEATTAAMEALGASRANITACLGMTISRAHYEVGPEFVARFTAVDGANARFFAPSGKPAHAMFDLPAYIMARLAVLGLGSIEDLALCTYADETRFYSYRRTTHREEPDYGRHISAITLLG